MRNIRPCEAPGCERTTGQSGTGHGLCKRHYLRWYRHGDAGYEPDRRDAGDGTVNKDGYRLITVDGKQVREHRHVMEQILGRQLHRSEHVHHIDHDKLNNDPENLAIVSPVEHNRAHGSFRNTTHKQCAKCGEIKPRWQFTPERQRRPEHDPHHTYCRDCRRQLDRATSAERWQREKARRAAS